VKPEPASGAAGTTVAILGTNLSTARSVTFNGTPASFGLLSATEIIATVPVGAKTGKIHVATATGTLTSNVSFRVP
jgi:hypothetical protein